MSEDSQMLPPSGEGRMHEYECGKAVGRGGYSIVYKGVRKSDRKTVAIKKVEIFDMAPKKRERCLQEVQLLQSLQHPNIISMVDSFIEDNMLIIIFEWALGGDLKRLIRRQADVLTLLDEPAIWGHFIQLTGALRYMHERRIMHRDIKPANVLVTATGLKLGDLGLGRHFSTNTNEAFSKVGTPYYVSPEVVHGAGYDWKSDVWSLGCLLYELATLRSPFEMEGANLVQVFKKISRAEYEPMKQTRHSTQLHQLVTRMLQIDPKNRPEMGEVDEMARRAVVTQAKTFGEVYRVSEIVSDKLALLGSEVKRFKEKFRPAAGLLVGVHPAYFAVPDDPAPGQGPRATPTREAAGLRLPDPTVSPSKFARFVRLVLWLLLLNGKKKVSLEMDLEAIANESEELPEPEAAPVGKENSDTNEGGQRSNRGTGEASSSNRTARDKIDVNRAFDVSPAQQKRIDLAGVICEEAARLGVSTEWTSHSSLAQGWGWPVCHLLTGLVDCTLSHLKVRARVPVYKDDEAEVVEEMGEEEERGQWNLSEMSSEEDEGDDPEFRPSPSSSPKRPGMRRSQADRNWDQLGETHTAFPSIDYKVGSQSQQGLLDRGRGGARESMRDSTTAVRGPHSILYSQVDPEAWYQEAERVAPSLQKITITSAGKDGKLASSLWPARLAALQDLSGHLQAAGPPAAETSGALARHLASDLEGIATREGMINGNLQQLATAYADVRRGLEEAQARRVSKEESVGNQTTMVADLVEDIERVKGEIDEAGSSIEGSSVLNTAKATVTSLRQELAEMNTHIAMKQMRLLKQLRKWKGAVRRSNDREDALDSDDDLQRL